MPKKDSRFDRVQSGKDMGRKVMKEMDNPKSPWSKERAMDMAMGSMTGSGIVSKLKGTQPVRKAADMVEKMSKREKGARSYVQESNRIEELSKSKGLKHIKTTAGEDKCVKNMMKGGREIDDFASKNVERTIKAKKGGPTTDERGFTSRGKPIGKKIGDIRPNRK